MKELKIRSRPVYDEYWHHITGEPSKKIIIKVDNKIKIRKLSRVNGRTAIVRSQEKTIEVKYLDF